MAAPCRAVAAERGRTMSGGGGRMRSRHVGRWRPNAAAPCRAGSGGRVMSGGGDRAMPDSGGRTMSGCPNGPRYNTPDVFSPTTRAAKIRARRQTLKTRMARETSTRAAKIRARRQTLKTRMARETTMHAAFYLLLCSNYARIMLDAFALLLFLKIFQHNFLKHIITRKRYSVGLADSAACGIVAR